MKELVKRILREHANEHEFDKLNQSLELFANTEPIKPKPVNRIELGLEQIGSKHYVINPRYYLYGNLKLRNYENDKYLWNTDLKKHIESYFGLMIQVGTFGIKKDKQELRLENDQKLKKLIFNYLDEHTQNLLIDDSGSFISFVWKHEWDNRFEKTPIVFNYHKKKSSIDFGLFWENKNNYPILTVHPPLIDTIDEMFGEGNEEIVGEWFEKKYELPVRTINWSEY